MAEDCIFCKIARGEIPCEKVYFNNECEMKYNEIMNALLERGVVKLENGSLFPTVKP